MVKFNFNISYEIKEILESLYLAKLLLQVKDSKKINYLEGLEYDVLLFNDGRFNIYDEGIIGISIKIPTLTNNITKLLTNKKIVKYLDPKALEDKVSHFRIESDSKEELLNYIKLLIANVI